MHSFYKRIRVVFRYAHSNRNQFCKKYGYNYQTLQAYWNTDKLPPGNVLEDIAKEYNVSLDVLVLGIAKRPVEVEKPDIRRITRSLEQLSKDDLMRVEGALKMFGYLASGGQTDGDAGTEADRPPEDDETWATLESVDEE